MTSILCDELIAPLQEHMLKYLPAPSLAALRQASHAMQHLSDDSTGCFWLDMAQKLGVTEQLLAKQAQHGSAVPAVLRQQAATLAQIRSGKHKHVLVGRGGTGIESELSWILQPESRGLHLIIKELAINNGPDTSEQSDAETESDTEYMSTHSRSLHEVLVADVTAAQCSALCQAQYDASQLNAHHTFQNDRGAFLLVGLGQTRRPGWQQQLLMYQLSPPSQQSVQQEDILALVQHKHIQFPTPSVPAAVVGATAAGASAACVGQKLAYVMEGVRVCIVDLASCQSWPALKPASLRLKPVSLRLAASTTLQTHQSL